MKTMLKKIRWDIALETVVVFSLLGAAMEWLHPGMVSDVVPWSAVATVAVGLVGAIVMTSRPPSHHGHPTKSFMPAAVVTVVVLTVAASAAAQAYFAPVPRFQPLLAAAAGLVVLFSAIVFVNDKR